jgi:hypothetical protein
MDEPAARRERLKALKEAAEAAGHVAQPDVTQTAPAIDASAQAAAQEPVLKFRNYAPRDEKLEHQKVRRCVCIRT